MYMYSSYNAKPSSCHTHEQPNVMGSFILGVISSGDQVGHGRLGKRRRGRGELDTNLEYAWGLLPRSHALNSHPLFIDLNFALRTGYLSSLTTFASWNLQMVQMMSVASGYLWLQSLVGYMLGFHFAYGSYGFGIFVARTINDAISDHSSTKQKYRQSTQETQSASAVSPSSSTRRDRRGAPAEEDGGDYLLEMQAASTSAVSPSSPMASPPPPLRSEYGERQQQTASAGDELTHDRVAHRGGDGNEDDVGGRSEGSGRYATTCVDNIRALSVRVQKREYYDRMRQRVFFASIGVNVMLFTLFGLLIGFNVGAGSNWAGRTYWISAILGPAGALLRWLLAAHLNGGAVIKSGAWAFFPLGTFAANILASVIDTVIAGAMNYRSSSIGTNAADGLNAVINGFCGALSTTSTFVSEVDGLAKRRGRERVAFVYATATIATALALGIATYGWSVWVSP